MTYFAYFQGRRDWARRPPWVRHGGGPDVEGAVGAVLRDAQDPGRAAHNARAPRLRPRPRGRDAARAACGDVNPDLVAIFDVDEPTAAGRMGLLRDRMEARGSAYHAAVRRGYHEQAETEPETHVLIDAARSFDHVFADFLAVLASRFGRPEIQSNSSPRNVEAK